MCIICNMGDHTNPKAMEAANQFLLEFEHARTRMRRSADLMLECSKLAAVPDARKHALEKLRTCAEECMKALPPGFQVSVQIFYQGNS